MTRQPPDRQADGPEKAAATGAPPPPLKEAPRFEGLKKAFGAGEASTLAQASALGLTFVTATLMGLGAGWWLDGKLGTAPWLLLAGLLVGIAAGFRNLFAFSARLTRREQARRAGPADRDPQDDARL